MLLISLNQIDPIVYILEACQDVLIYNWKVIKIIPLIKKFQNSLQI